MSRVKVADVNNRVSELQDDVASLRTQLWVITVAVIGAIGWQLSGLVF